jgi:predicted nucleotide-binding protein
MPSDILGVLHIQFLPGDGWKVDLAKELKAAGFPVDGNKIL